MFLAQGFGRTTLDQVSEAAHTGKTTLYGRFPNKEALFAAVVRRSIETMFAELEPIPTGLSRNDRLRHAGRELARAYLAPRCIALIRMTGAEASNFPLLATMAYDFSMAGSAKYVAGALVEDSAVTAIESVLPHAQRFVEVALHSTAFQAMFGSDPAALLTASAKHVDDAIVVLSAEMAAAKT